jgi:hypothetical protein
MQDTAGRSAGAGRPARQEEGGCQDGQPGAIKASRGAQEIQDQGDQKESDWEENQEENRKEKGCCKKNRYLSA